MKKYSPQNNYLTSTSWISWLLLLPIVLLVAGRRTFILLQKPAHLSEISRAHGYVGLIYGVPQANADGSRIAYSQMDAAGIGVFLLDLASGHKQLVHEKVSADDWFQNLDVWPWSPDGKYFLYTHTNLFVCDGISGRVVGDLPVDGLNGIRSLVWLDNTSFVYVSRGGTLHQFKEQNDDRWYEVTPKRIKAGADNLTALSEDTICWQKGDSIYRLNLASNITTVLFHTRTNHLTGFSYAPPARQFLATFSNESGSSISRMRLDGGTPLVNNPSATAHEIKWLNDDHGAYAYIADTADEPEARHLEISTKGTALPVKLFEKGTVDGFSTASDSGKIFIVGALTNESASSIWSYDAESKKLQCVVAGEDYPSPYATRVNAEHFTVRLNGGTFTYHLYKPLNLDPKARKKYPVVLGDTLYKALDPAYENRVHGPYWAPMLANAGAYVVIVERPGSWGNEMDRWEDYVDWTLKKIMENPTIDPHQVYLYATSAETTHLSHFVEQHPGCCSGLIFLSPSSLPDLKKLSAASLPPKIFISQGVLEGTNRVHNYQLEAAKNGVRVEYHTHENNSHILLGKQGMGERAEAMAKFVFGD